MKLILELPVVLNGKNAMWKIFTFIVVVNQDITFKYPCFKKMKFDEFEKDVVSWGANKVENFERGYDFIKEYKESEIVAFSGDFFPDEYWIGIDKRNMLLINFYCSG